MRRRSPEETKRKERGEEEVEVKRKERA